MRMRVHVLHLPSEGGPPKDRSCVSTIRQGVSRGRMMSPFHRNRSSLGQQPSPLLDWGSVKARTEPPKFLWASVSLPRFSSTETALVLVPEPGGQEPKGSEALGWTRSTQFGDCAGNG